MTSSRSIRVAFDTAGSRAAGVGHVLRALSLADRLRRNGVHASLVNRVPRTPLGSHDLAGTVRPPDVIVIDRPDTTAALIARRHRRWPAARIVALDYYGRPVDGLVAVINLNPGRERSMAVRPRGYRGGLRYATLRPSFLDQRRRRRKVPVRARRILIGFGGTDPSAWTAAAVRALGALPDVTLDVLTGRSLPRDAAARHDRVAIHAGLADPAALLRSCDLAVIGGGTMMIEAACLGLPAVVIPRTPEERVFARAFADAGAVVLLNRGRGFPAAAVRDRAGRLLADRPARRRMSRAGRRLIDGRGAERVARVIMHAGGMVA